MPSYVVLTRLRVRDPDEFKLYLEEVPSLMNGHKGKRIAGGGQLEVLEGANAEAAFILEFPTFEEAKAWYGSPQYQAASRHRYLGGDFSVMIVEGPS